MSTSELYNIGSKSTYQRELLLLPKQYIIAFTHDKAYFDFLKIIIYVTI